MLLRCVCSFAVIVACVLPSLSCVSFCCRHSRALPGNPVLGRIHRTGFPPSARMTAGEGDGHSYLLARMTCVCLLPSLSCVRVAVILVRVFLLPSFSGLARESSSWANTQDWIPAFGENDGGEAMVIPAYRREQRSGFPPLARMMGRHHPTGFVRSAERIRQGCETMSWCIRGRCQCLAHVCRLCKTVFCNSPGPFIPPPATPCVDCAKLCSATVHATTLSNHNACVDCAKLCSATVPFLASIRLIPETIQVYWRKGPLEDLLSLDPSYVCPTVTPHFWKQKRS